MRERINLCVLNPLYIIKYTIQELREVVRERFMNLELIIKDDIYSLTLTRFIETSQEELSTN